MKQGPAMAAMAAIALLSLGCAGTPRQSPSAPAAPATAGSPSPAPALARPEFSDLAKRPIGYPAIFLSLPDPQPLAQRPSSVLPGRSALAVLPQSTLPQEGLPSATASTTAPPLAPAPLPVPLPPALSGAVPVRLQALPDGLLSIDSLPDRLPAKLRPALASPVLALPVAPAVKAATAPAASGGAAKTPVASPPAAKPAGPSAAPGTSPAAKPAPTSPTAPQAAAGSSPAVPAPSLPPAVPSTLPTVDPKAERQPDIARNIAVELGMRIEIPFEGTGWTYLGERDGRDGILYESRRYEGPGLVFVLNTARLGDFILRFQKQDLLRGTANEELIAVKVTPRTAAKAPPQASGGTLPQTAVPAQAQPPVLPAAPASPAKPATAGAPTPTTPATMAPQATAPATTPTATSPAPSQSPVTFAASLPASPDALLASAKSELSGGRVANALAALDRFLALRPEGLDELFYLYGVALEQNGHTKDIKKAYAWYKKLRDGYPQSQFWDLAAARMSYIERQYFDIR